MLLFEHNIKTMWYGVVVAYDKILSQNTPKKASGKQTSVNAADPRANIWTSHSSLYAAHVLSGRKILPPTPLFQIRHCKAMLMYNLREIYITNSPEQRSQENLLTTAAQTCFALRRGASIFSSPPHADRTLEPPSLPSNEHSRLSRKKNLQKTEANHSQLPSTEVKNARSHTSQHSWLVHLLKHNMILYNRQSIIKCVSIKNYRIPSKIKLL